MGDSPHPSLEPPEVVPEVAEVCTSALGHVLEHPMSQMSAILSKGSSELLWHLLGLHRQVTRRKLA